MTDSPSYEVVDVTPELAGEWLARNTHNRKLRPAVVAGYADDMTNGRWCENGESIKRTHNGMILDGQHRLHAIVASGVTMRILVVGNLPDAAQETVDTGARRMFSDVLTLRGEPNATMLAAVARRVFMWQRGYRSHGGRFKPTNGQLAEVVERHPELRDSILVGNRLRHALPVSGSVVGLCHWLFAAIDNEDALYFFERLAEDPDLPPDHPIRVLRRTILDIRKSARSSLNDTLMTAYLIKTWNSYRDGRPMGLLRFRPGGANPESFPEPK